MKIVFLSYTFSIVLFAWKKCIKIHDECEADNEQMTRLPVAEKAAMLKNCHNYL